jgi:hypothetical protein
MDYAHREWQWRWRGGGGATMVAVVTLGKWHRCRSWGRAVVGDGGDREEGDGSIIEKGKRGGEGGRR